VISTSIHPAAMLAALAERTGVEVAQLRAMTLAGWEPWLFDTLHLDQSDAQQTFDTYVRADSVLLAPGEAGRNHTGSWQGPWLPARPLRRTCPLCAADPARGTALMWRLPLVASCPEHGCRLEPVLEVAFAASRGQPMMPVPVNKHLAVLDRRTYQGMDRQGRAAGPAAARRRVVSAAAHPAGRGQHVAIASGVRSRATLERIWQAAGHPIRAGLAVWRPYERLDWSAQEMMLHAAAVALHLADTGAITPRGTLGTVLAPEPHRPAYDGDLPRRVAQPWRTVHEALEADIEAARADPDAARQMLAWLTIDRRTLDRFEEERTYLVGIGIPADFLPNARELYHGDPT
jgi:hypothetical protein